MSVTQFWKLDSPKMARDFLKSLRIGPQGAKIQFVELEGGRQVSLDDADDEEIVRFAQEIAQAIKGKKK